MTRRPLIALQWIAAVCLLWTGADVLAAKVSSQTRSGYQRVNFTFGQPTRLTVQPNGSTLVLRFSAPLKQSPDAIEAALGSYIRNASISADGKNLTLAMTKPFRTRHFVSGSTVGVDFIDSDDASTEKTIATNNEKEVPAEELLTTKKPAVKKPVEKKPTAAVEKSRPVIKTAEEKPAPAIVTKKEAPVVPPAVVVVAETKQEPAPPIASPQPAPVEAVAPAPKTSGPFVVTVRTRGTMSTINFPHNERTATAVFERGNTIWIIFSHPADLNISLLKTVLPKTVKEAVQYSYAGNSVLRLTTDGSIHATAENLKASYQWNVTLAPTATPPENNVGVTGDASDGKPRLLVGAFDVAPPLQFYDPSVGDLLIVIPSYEASHGVSRPRNFPEISLLESNQGIAIASARDDLTTNTSRLGVAIESPQGLVISKDLSVMNSSGPVLGLNSGVLLPYNEWFVAPEKFHDTVIERQENLRNATKDSRAEALYSLATLYLGQGRGAEALGYLDLLAANEPEFFKNRKLALLSVAAHSLERHLDSAAEMLASPELNQVKEAELWHEYLGLFVRKPNAVQQIQQATEKGVSPSDTLVSATSFSMADDHEDVSERPPEPDAVPAPPPSKPIMRFLKYNREFIRFYPPKIRQMIASAASDAYIANGLEEKSIAALDTLNRDDLLTPLRYRAEYSLALIAAKNKKLDQAEEILTRVETQNEDVMIKARARAKHALLLMQAGKKTPEETADAIEQARMTWRGDATEVDMLKTLAKIYKDAKQYDDALRALKTLTDAFIEEPDYLVTSGEMSDLFEQLYLGGLADEMPPLKSLSLFYEFRDLTPIGDKGDLIIQKLADRLAAFDLIDRATQLLENQINFRVSGETRSRVGARLGLLYLFNHQPQEALKVLEVTNFGNNPPDLQRQRLQLTAQALSGLGRHADALNMIYNDTSDAGNLLKLDIFWAAQDWPNVVNIAESVLAKRIDLTATLTPIETEVLLKLALGYSFQGDYTQLRYLRDYYSALIPETGYKKIFEFITNDTNPLDREDSAMLTEQISRTEGFMSLFKEKIVGGKLSEAVK